MFEVANIFTAIGDVAAGLWANQPTRVAIFLIFGFALGWFLG